MGDFGAVPALPDLRSRLRAAAERLAALPRPLPQEAAAESTAVGSLYGAAGDMEDAARAYDRALSMPGDHARIASLMVLQYFAAGQPQQAVMAAQRLQAREPESADFMVLLARAYGRAGQRDRAADWLHRADQQMVGQPAPDFTLDDAAGQPVHLADLRGRAVLLFFFTPYGNAQTVAKHLESLRQQYGDEGLSILALDPSAEHQPAINFARGAFAYPLLLDAVPVFEAYGIYRIPTLILIDPHGKVAARHSGIDPDLAARLAEEVRKAMPGRAAAR